MPENSQEVVSGMPETPESDITTHQENVQPRPESGRVTWVRKTAQQIPGLIAAGFWGAVRFIGRVIRAVVFGDDRITEDAARSFKSAMDATANREKLKVQQEEASRQQEAAHEVIRQGKNKEENSQEKVTDKDVDEEMQRPCQSEEQKEVSEDESVDDASWTERYTSEDMEKEEDSAITHEDDLETGSVLEAEPYKRDDLPLGPRSFEYDEINRYMEAVLDENIIGVRVMEPIMVSAAEQEGCELISDGYTDCFGNAGSGIAKLSYAKKGKEYEFYVAVDPQNKDNKDEIVSAIKEGKALAIAMRYLDGYNTRQGTSLQISLVGEDKFVLEDGHGQSMSFSKKDLGGGISRPVSILTREIALGNVGKETDTQGMRPILTADYAESLIKRRQQETLALAVNCDDARMFFAIRGLAVAVDEKEDKIYLKHFDGNRILDEGSWILTHESVGGNDIDSLARNCEMAIYNGAEKASTEDAAMIDAMLAVSYPESLDLDTEYMTDQEESSERDEYAFGQEIEYEDLSL